MDFTEFKSLKENFNKKSMPSKLVYLDDIESIGDNFFMVGNQEVCFSEQCNSIYDNLIGIQSKQSKTVRRASGDLGYRNFRNYMNTAKGMEKRIQALLIANPKSREVANILPIKNQYISADMFFDFTETFMNKNNYEIDKIDTYTDPYPEISVYLKPINENIEVINKNDEFLTNGIFLNWTPSQVDVGNYFLRLICVNGQIITQKNKINIAYSLMPNDFNKLLNIRFLLEKGFEHFKQKAIEASKVKASMAEYELAYNKLAQCMNEEKLANEIMPYTDEANTYEMAGYDLSKIKKYALSSKNVWDLYNELTYFATHKADNFEPKIKRKTILTTAQYLLYKKRDVINYQNIFV